MMRQEKAHHAMLKSLDRPEFVILLKELCYARYCVKLTFDNVNGILNVSAPGVMRGTGIAAEEEGNAVAPLVAVLNLHKGK